MNCVRRELYKKESKNRHLCHHSEVMDAVNEAVSGVLGLKSNKGEVSQLCLMTYFH